ncbi:MAG: T9SS type A sorting domain-containing protein, partial [Bacteroidetes bacterium]|nr:T9SS type A sorting domain-containing protein [Bacteroidota bacterium]
YCSLVNNNIGIDWCERAHVQQCVIDSNISFGIRTVQSDTILNCEIKYNGIGLVVSTSGGGDPSFVSENIIESNTIGIQLENGFNNDQIYCNMFCNNTSYDLKTTLSTNTNCVLNNYWCSTDSVIISSHIWDGYDDAGLGLITFIPFDTTQCYLTGCALGVSANVTNATCDTCHNGSATSIVTNGFAPYTYTWFTAPIQTTQTAIGMAPGTYTLCVTDGHGCTACNNSIFIDSTNCSGFSMYTNATNATCSACNDGAAWVIVNGGSAPYYYSWYTVPVQTTDTAINLMQGTYAVCVTDVYGCTICDSVAVGTGNCSAHFNLYPDTAAHHYYVVNMASGVAPLTYDWNWGDSTTHDTTPYPDHTYAQAGFYTICLGITDSVGCTNTFCTNFYLQHNTNAMVYVNVIPNGPVGIKENTLSTFSIYPNPTHSSFTIINTSDSTLSLIQILNPIGEIVYFEKLTGNDVQVIYPHLAAGFYFVQLSNVEGKATKKLIVE